MTFLAPESGSNARAFDLNVESVLDHWTVGSALREVVANALDEAVLTGADEPKITEVAPSVWIVRDYGRGLEHKHLSQNESDEKAHHESVIGQFGVGLKDALATFHRQGIGVEIHSKFGDFSLIQQAKAGFEDVSTLHVLFSNPSKPDLVGTEFVLKGVTDSDVSEVRAMFLRFSGIEALAQTAFGEILDVRDRVLQGRIYVRGLLIAKEDNFRFSYNITKLDAGLRKALNRERTNVGRTAYSAQLKKMLTGTDSEEVARILVDEFRAIESGTNCDEITWREVSVFATKALHSQREVVFVTAEELQTARSDIDHVGDDGREVVVVTQAVRDRLRSEPGFDGSKMLDLGGFRQAYNDSFVYEYVDPDDLTPDERRMWDLRPAIIHMVLPAGEPFGFDVRISAKMRLAGAHDDVAGQWRPEAREIVIRRDQLSDITSFGGVLLHEVAHAMSGASDVSRDFEDFLSKYIGLLVGGLASRIGD